MDKVKENVVSPVFFYWSMLMLPYYVRNKRYTGTNKDCT